MLYNLAPLSASGFIRALPRLLTWVMEMDGSIKPSNSARTMETLTLALVSKVLSEATTLGLFIRPRISHLVYVTNLSAEFSARMAQAQIVGHSSLRMSPNFLVMRILVDVRIPRVSKEENVIEHHTIVSDGYNVGR